MQTTFRVGDMVKLANPEKFAGSFIYKENVFIIAAINADGINLSALQRTVTTEDIHPVKIDGTEDRNIVYRPIVAAPSDWSNNFIPNHYIRYTDDYYLDAFTKTKFTNLDRTLRDLVCEQNFEYVHEIQRFLYEMYSDDRLAINYSVI